MYLKNLKRRIVRSYAKQRIVAELQTELVPCPLCGQSGPFMEVVPVDRYGIKIKTVFCQCGFMFENPMPTEFFLNYFYGSFLFRALDWGVFSVSSKIVHEFHAEKRAQKHINLLKKFVSSETKGKTILDIGASEGTFLKKLGESYQTVARFAVEPGNNFSKLIDSGVLQVWPSFDLIPADSKFDLITMWHVLEHIRDPRSFVKKMARHCLPGGYVFIEVPDADKYDTTMRPYHIDHVVHFSGHTLSKLLLEEGFIVLGIESDPEVLMDELYGVAIVAQLQ